MSERGVGAPVLRNEDDRFLRGKGQFVSDIAPRGFWHAAFRRSDEAHARIKSTTLPEGAQGRIFTAADLTGLTPIRAVSTIPGFKAADFPVLAIDRVRFVGEPIAVAVAPTRAEAEDLAQAVTIEFERLEVVLDPEQARRPGAPVLHEQWGDNVALETLMQGGDIEIAKKEATHVVNREYRTARQVQMPMEARACLAHYDGRLDELVIYLASQCPHLMRVGIAKALGLEQRRVRVVAPDVGGGFGTKAGLEAEAIAVAWLSMHLDRPIRWDEDRLEHMVVDANCRDHYYKISAYVDDRGKILGLDCEVTVDAGAYAIWPWTSALEAAMAGGILAGPYDIKHYRAKTTTVATNKPTIIPYRGVARAPVCFADELTVDAVARVVGREPHEVRIENMVGPEQMPYLNVANKLFDSGDYPESVRHAAELIDVAAVRARQQRGEPDGRLIGLGFGSYTEQSAHGTQVFAQWGVEIVPGHEMATARLTPDGDLVLEVAIQSHGQGMETTLAQVANEVLGIDPTRVAVRHGDSSYTPYGTGTYASRSMVMAGGAVARACQGLGERIAKIGAHLLQAEIDQVKVADAEVVGPGGSVSFTDIGRAWYSHPEELPEDVDPGGLTVTTGYKPDVDTGVFSYSTHAAVVAVDAEIGTVELLDYVVVEDCGTMVNPLIVDGQIIGGTAQGIGTALYEEAVYNAQGQPIAVTLADYIIPGATEVPDIKIDHMVTPSPYTAHGQKGMGEGSAVAPPAAIVNAVNDALRGYGVELTETPITPRRVVAAIAAATGA